MFPYDNEQGYDPAQENALGMQPYTQGQPNVFAPMGGMGQRESALGEPAPAPTPPPDGGEPVPPVPGGGPFGSYDFGGGGGDGGVHGAHYAAKTMAKLTREQWEDWRKRFRPYENLLMQETTYMNPRLLNSSLKDALQSSRGQFRASIGEYRRGLKGYGIKSDKNTNRQMDKMANLGKTASLVDAANSMRQRIMDRDREIAFGGLAGSQLDLNKQLSGGGGG